MMEIVELGKGNNLKGKAGRLNELYNKFNIAKGFIIPYSYFKKFLNYNNILLNDDFEEIKAKIEKGIFPDEEELCQYFLLNGYNNVIVRSSASNEDGDKHSMAGQFSSYLNTNINTLISNIKKCWLSQFTNNYYCEKAFSFDVLVQEMIISDISGVAFSVNPASGDSRITIEVSTTSCDNVVSGKVIPNIYYINDKMPKSKIISQDKFLVICQNLKRLKKMYQKEVEIEFCFRNDTFYLLQVRPITKVYFALNDYINKTFWCSFKNNNWTLFNRSLWILGATKYKNKCIYNNITEDITLYYPNNLKQIRGFNGSQKPLDKRTLKKQRVSNINEYITSFNKIAEDIKDLSSIIKNNIQENNFTSFKGKLRRIIKLNALINSYEYLISSLAYALESKIDHDTYLNIASWKNRTDNSYFPIYDDIFAYILKHFNIDMSPRKFRMYIHVSEVLNLCFGKLKAQTILKRIKKREQKGFVLLNLWHPKYQNKVIMDEKTICCVKSRFLKLNNNYQKKGSNFIKGKSTFKNGKIIKGKCVVIKDNRTNIKELDLENKILVCPITTAKDGNYLKKAKAIITDNGGVLCHSAIFSREYNIPCLMGCEVATNYFKTGDMLIYNVDAEYVQKL